jgi:hypothetical protein
MKIMLYVGTEGFADSDFRDGDIFAVHPDSWEPGAKEKQRYLIVQTADYAGDWAELVKSEYAPGPGAEPVIRRQRAYRVDYAPKLEAEELAAARNRTVSVEPITGRFTLADIARK